MKESPLRIEFEGPFPVGEGEEEWVAFMPNMKGMVVSAPTKEQAFEEMMISIKVKAAYDSNFEL